MKCKEVSFHNSYFEKNEPNINSLHFDDARKSVSFQIFYMIKMKCKEVRFQNSYIEKNEM